MNSYINEATTAKLQEFISRLQSRIPETDIKLEIKQWPNNENSKHELILQVANPAFNFDLQANGENLEIVLKQLEDNFSDQIGQRKAITFMMLEGIDSDSPVYSSYLQ